MPSAKDLPCPHPRFARLLLLNSFLLIGIWLYWHATAAARPATDLNRLPMVRTVYFPATGHHLSNRVGFLDFWRAHGQLHSFGMPISEELVIDGRIVQYFERARFEYHPEYAGTPLQVQLGLIGREWLERQQLPLPPPAADQTGAFFAETGYTLQGEFLEFWERRGGLPIFGFPISAEHTADGVIIQYFERARLRYQPEALSPFLRQQQAIYGFDLDTLYEVAIDDLGRQLANLLGINTAPVARLPGAVDWSPALWPRRIEVDLARQQLFAYEDQLLVFTAPVATGRDGFNTPRGDFAIYYRLPEQTMTGCLGGECWYVPNIPWVQYVVGGVALHGTYWHNAHGSGVRMSHGCINLRIDDAQWLYEWADLGVPVMIY
ncbi:L,D-transpeptidase [Chloroflexus sp.]|uniref:L,D-transpeptidase n=1 Tax=Chloroflexus sp. TaxID=1904827 RepID=UPI00298ED1B8|nr:L,D-transpeptidase [Chloroflexus sp.]MDW8405177.1 L,D-transpeptidase [Chloroflexus sp.]